MLSHIAQDKALSWVGAIFGQTTQIRGLLGAFGGGGSDILWRALKGFLT